MHCTCTFTCPCVHVLYIRYSIFSPMQGRSYTWWEIIHCCKFEFVTCTHNIIRNVHLRTCVPLLLQSAKLSGYTFKAVTDDPLSFTSLRLGHIKILVSI